MTQTVVDNLNVVSQDVLITPEQLKAELPMSEAAASTVAESREVIRNILDGKDHRCQVLAAP